MSCSSWLHSIALCGFVMAGGLAHAAAPVAAPKPPKMERQWQRLGGTNQEASLVIWQFVEDDPRRAVSLIAKKLRPATFDFDHRTVEEWIRQLDDPKFSVRNRAAAALRKTGPPAEPLLQKVLEQPGSAELHFRVKKLLHRIRTRRPATAEQRRTLRALRILEHIGNPAAVKTLQRMAGGHAGAVETRRAAQALKRLQRFAGRPATRNAGKLQVGRFDWPQWGGTSLRNNTPLGFNIPATWDVKTGKNIKWKAKLGSQTYGNPVVANGRVYIGTNNGAGYLKRFPPSVDLGVLLCFEEATGKFLWQYSAKKLPTGRVHDWPMQGMPATPVVDGDRLWTVTNRCEVVCLDTDGFQDGKNDGPFRREPNRNQDEADVVWTFDMMGRLGVSPHNMSNCSITTAGGLLFVCTSNGVDASHVNLPAPAAPSFICLDRETGKLVWKDNSPGRNILHGQWASPTYFSIGEQHQVLFPGGDGWLYSFDPRGDGKGNAKLLWKFDCNPKTSKWVLGGRGTRNNIIGFACVAEGLIYIAVGQHPEHGEGNGRLGCIDPMKKLDGSDVSPTLAVDRGGKRIPHRRLQAVDPNKGEREIKNPNSAAIWHFDKQDDNGDGEFDFEETFHRTIGTPVIKDGILYITDFSGLVHCLDARTGQRWWAYDMFASSWGSPLVVDGKVYIGDEDGDVAIFPHTRDPRKALRNLGKDPKPALGEIRMLNSVYSTPIVANNVLYIANKNTLYAISPGGK